jgi:transglutaminase-like putative cysteine protease
MKKVILLLFVLISFNSVFAQEDYNIYNTLEIDFSLNSEISLVGSGTLSELSATVFLNPQNDNLQEIISSTESSNPLASITSGEKIIFLWESQNTNYEFGFDKEIKTTNKLFKVPEIVFPYSELSSEYQKYLQSEETIDITPEIISKTSEIIKAEDNAYLAVHRVGNWIHSNIEYNLTTLTEKASQKSSWVLENEYGVCDEITSLFISMTRSMGIPARFVSGMAYTNLGDTFGNHGWAEVYYPEYGWVPYDVTYGHLGWIDPTHISLQKSEDIASSIIYEWQASGNLNIDASRDISTIASVSSTGTKISPIFETSIVALKDNVAPGSYVPVRIKINNPFSYYISNNIVLTKAPGNVESNQKLIALKPLEEKEIFWIFQLPEDTQENYIYTTTVEFKDLYGSTDSTIITFSEDNEFVTLAEAKDIVDSLTIDEEDSYSNQIVLNCNPKKSYFYSFEVIEVNCMIRTFNGHISGLSLCLDENCEEFDMPSNSEKEVTFQFGSKKDPIKAILKNSEIEIKRNVLLTIIDKPHIEISRIELEEVNYDEEIDLPITISSLTPLKNLILKINNFQPVEFSKLNEEKIFTLTINSKHLNSEKIKISLEYEDEYGNIYTQEYAQRIIVNNLPWYWEFINLFRS